MATPKKLPSGKWRVQVYDKDTRKRVSFTADTKRKADLLAIEWQEGKRESKDRGMTVEEVLDRYIDGRDGVISPSTIDGYWRIKKYYLSPELAQIPVKNVTEEIMQEEVKKLCKRYSPKTVHNAYGLIKSVIVRANKDVDLDGVTLPPIQKKQIELPEPEEVFSAIKGTDIELPALLAMWLSLSVSEIRGISTDEIKDGVLTIRETVVQVNGVAVRKESTKEFDRARRLAIPPYIMGLIEKTDAYVNGTKYIETRSVTAIGCRFRRVLEKAGVPHMTFHQLRHMNASVMSMLNVPDKYAQERGGWKTDYVMKKVYQHTFSKKREAVDKTMDDFFEEVIKA